MKKHFFLLLLFTSIVNLVLPQIAFQDSKGVIENCVSIQSGDMKFKTDNPSVKALAAYLRNYLPDQFKNDPSITEDLVFAQFAKNPFFGVQIQELRSGGASPGLAGSLKSTASTVGGLDVTTVADGVARFLVERTKQELNIYFFAQFKNFLEDTTHGKDIQALFPNTYSILLLVGDEIYNYQHYLQSMREAFAQDLSALLINVNSWANQVQPNSSIVKAIQGSELYKYLQVALLIAVDLQQGKHPGDVLTELSGKSFLVAIHVDLAASAKTADLISQSIRSNSGSRYWIDSNGFKSFENPIFTRIYLGLLYQQAKIRSDIKFANGKTLDQIIAELVSNTNQFKQFMDRLNLRVNDSEQILNQLQSNTGAGIAQNYVSLASNIMETVHSLHDLFPADVSDTKFLKDAQYMVTHTTNLMADVRTKSYSAGVVELSLIFAKLNVGNEDFSKGFLKYGTFMANVASAQTSEEVQQAIEVIALPPGSYQIKRESRVNISLNGYLGLYGADEYLPASEKKHSFSAGVFAPVGVAFSAGGRNCSVPSRGKSHSLFVSFIDVGALASFRFNDPNTSVSPTIELQDIVAPGLYYIFGLGRSPLSIGAGGQLGPNLRNIDPAGNPEINTDYYFRLGGFIAVDIPFLTLLNRKDKKIDNKKKSKK